MILQRDVRLLPEIQEQGCYFMSILFFINKYRNNTWTTDNINEFYKTMVHIGAVMADGNFSAVGVDDSTIINPELIFRMKGLNVRYNDRHDPPSYTCDSEEFEILKFVRGGYSHFVCGDGSGHVAYDPWGDSNTVRFGSLNSKRIFRRL